MRTLAFFLALAPALLSGPDADDDAVRSEEFNFSISMPDSIDWTKEKLPTDASKSYIKAYFRTEYTGTDPLAYADVQLMVLPLARSFVKKGPESIAKAWVDSMEGSLTHTRDLKEGKGTLGGRECWSRSLKGEFGSGVAHLTWEVAKMGKHVYVFYALRAYDAVGDEDLEEEIKEIRDSFKFLKEIEEKAHKDGDKAKPAAPGGNGNKGDDGPKVDPNLVKRERVDLGFWRVKMVKPQGLKQIPPSNFSASEKDPANNVVAKFEGRQDQTYILIRIFAQSSTSQRYTLEQVMERNLKRFQQTYAEKRRLEPEVDENYRRKVHLADEAIFMKLVGRRAQPETTYWILAQCKNDRQYQVEIYMTGATGEKIWKKQVDDFLKNFKPYKK